MKGTELPDKTAASFDEAKLQTVWNVLNRVTPVDSLTELYNGLSQKTRRPPFGTDKRLAFGFDTNAIFRLGLGPQGANALDYLGERNEGPVIIPGQAIQELWNNFLAGAEPKAKAVSKRLDELESEMQAIGQELGVLGGLARDAVGKLLDSHGDWTDPAAVAELDGTLKTLLEVASVTYVPRDAFYNLGLVRKQTKTPPGFRDDAQNFGDYFIWADFLYGLAISDLRQIDSVVFVTNDQKQDWSRNGVPHPVLVSEVKAVTGKDFRLWKLDEFRAHAKKIVS